MDILISDNWLRDYIETKATPKQIAESVSLCGPSVEKYEKIDGDTIYHVEITTNRVDCASVYGFAREICAILPRFDIPVKLKPLSVKPKFKTTEYLPFNIECDEKLVRRAMGIVLTQIENWDSPAWMKKRLTACGVRSLNAVVDITNYIMLEIGHPSHAFDYDKIKNKKFVIRESKKGESVTSFDGKTYKLNGGDIIFDDGDGEIIDLPGIIGTKNSVVDNNTTRVLFFIDNNNPIKIRNTSMGLAIRTLAAGINEKDPDPNLGETALNRGIQLFQNICKAKISSRVFDFYPKPPNTKTIQTSKEFIDNKLGTVILKDDIGRILKSLEFIPVWNRNMLSVSIPSFRVSDMDIPEDLVEEIARIYGYRNLPSILMDGIPPISYSDTQIGMEWKIKNTLKALGGFEVYTLSLVPENYVGGNKSLQLKNPLGNDQKYLRTSLSPSLVEAIISNTANYDKLFIYEIANVYLPKEYSLPDEKMVLGIVFDGYKYNEVKGIIETVIQDVAHINITIDEGVVENTLLVKSGNDVLGSLVERDDGLYTLEILVKKLTTIYEQFPSFKAIPKYPPQIEDVTIVLPKDVKIGNVINSIYQSSKLINQVELKDIFNNSYTFRIYYQDPDKTLSNDEINKVRKEVGNNLQKNFRLTIN